MTPGPRFSVFLVFARRLLAGIVAVYVLASLVLGGSRTAWPAFWASAIGWAGFLCYWHCRRTRPGRERQPDQRLIMLVWRWLEIVGVNVALTLLLGEGSLRALALWTGNSVLVSTALGAYRLVPGRDYGGGLRGNQLGYPGGDFVRTKPPGIYRIAALGDSFALGPAVPFAENYLTLMETSLAECQVYNFGVSGTGPREYDLILRQDVWSFQPDLLLVWLFIGNDITEQLATPRHMDPRHLSLYLLLERGGRLWCERQRGGLPQEPRAERWRSSTLAERTFQEVEGRRLIVCLQPPPPVVEKKWQRAFSYLERMVKECRRQCVPIIVVLIPDEFQINPKVLNDALAESRLSPDAVDLNFPQQRLCAFFADRGVPCLDLLPAFQRAPDTYAPQDTHWNVRGNRLATECIVKWLQRLPANS